MEVIRKLRQIRPRGLVRQARNQRGVDPDRGADGLEIAGRPPVQIDPEQLSLADPFGQSRFELDLAVLAIGVIEADMESALARAGRRGDQWRTASSTATTTATNAVAYCSTSIDRSTCWVTGGSIAPGWGIRDTV
jgi:hypothetical protein